jgi:anaerobic selenocysteine-containing dehydrogenase
MCARRQGWHVLSNGPDWRDVQQFARTIEVEHVCTVYVHMQPIMNSSGGEWSVRVFAQLVGKWEDTVFPGYGVGGVYPNPESRSLPGYVYALLVRLDWDIGSGQRANSKAP